MGKGKPWDLMRRLKSMSKLGEEEGDVNPRSWQTSNGKQVRPNLRWGLACVWLLKVAQADGKATRGGARTLQRHGSASPDDACRATHENGMVCLWRGGAMVPDDGRPGGCAFVRPAGVTGCPDSPIAKTHSHIQHTQERGARTRLGGGGMPANYTRRKDPKPSGLMSMREHDSETGWHTPIAWAGGRRGGSRTTGLRTGATDVQDCAARSAETTRASFVSVPVEPNIPRVFWVSRHPSAQENGRTPSSPRALPKKLPNSHHPDWGT